MHGRPVTPHLDESPISSECLHGHDPDFGKYGIVGHCLWGFLSVLGIFFLFLRWRDLLRDTKQAEQERVTEGGSARMSERGPTGVQAL